MWFDGKSGLTGPSASQGNTQKLGGAKSSGLADALTQMRLGREGMTQAPEFDPATHGGDASSSSPMNLDGYNVLNRYAPIGKGGGRWAQSRSRNARLQDEQYLREQMAAPSYNPDLPTIYAETERPNPFGLGSLFKGGR